MALHSSPLAWKIPWMEEPGGLQSMWSLRVWHDWVTSLSLFTFMHWRRKWQPTPVFLPGRIPERKEPGGLPSMGSHRVRHDWSDLAEAAAAAQAEELLVKVSHSLYKSREPVWQPGWPIIWLQKVAQARDRAWPAYPLGRRGLHNSALIQTRFPWWFLKVLDNLFFLLIGYISLFLQTKFPREAPMWP